jgi:hypothetical protein
MLTGTPLQNDLIELNNLLTFLLPNIFAGQGMGERLFADSRGFGGEGKLTSSIKPTTKNMR